MKKGNKKIFSYSFGKLIQNIEEANIKEESKEKNIVNNNDDKNTNREEKENEKNTKRIFFLINETIDLIKKKKTKFYKKIMELLKF